MGSAVHPWSEGKTLWSWVSLTQTTDVLSVISQSRRNISQHNESMSQERNNLGLSVFLLRDKIQTTLVSHGTQVILSWIAPLKLRQEWSKNTTRHLSIIYINNSRDWCKKFRGMTRRMNIHSTDRPTDRSHSMAANADNFCFINHHNIKSTQHYCILNLNTFNSLSGGIVVSCHLMHSYNVHTETDPIGVVFTLRIQHYPQLIDELVRSLMD